MWTNSFGALPATVSVAVGLTFSAAVMQIAAPPPKKMLNWGSKSANRTSGSQKQHLTGNIMKVPENSTPHSLDKYILAAIYIDNGLNILVL